MLTYGGGICAEVHLEENMESVIYSVNSVAGCHKSVKSW